MAYTCSAYGLLSMLRQWILVSRDVLVVAGRRIGGAKPPCLAVCPGLLGGQLQPDGRHPSIYRWYAARPAAQNHN